MLSNCVIPQGSFDDVGRLQFGVRTAMIFGRVVVMRRAAVVIAGLVVVDLLIRLATIIVPTRPILVAEYFLLNRFQLPAIPILVESQLVFLSSIPTYFQNNRGNHQSDHQKTDDKLLPGNLLHRSEE